MQREKMSAGGINDVGSASEPIEVEGHSGRGSVRVADSHQVAGCVIGVAGRDSSSPDAALQATGSTVGVGGSLIIRVSFAQEKTAICVVIPGRNPGADQAS